MFGNRRTFVNIINLQKSLIQIVIHFNCDAFMRIGVMTPNNWIASNRRKANDPVILIHELKQFIVTLEYFW